MIGKTEEERSLCHAWFPLSLLIPISNVSRFVAFDIETRIDPVNWLSPKINTLIFGRVIPMLNGRDPWIWFSDTAKVNKEEELYIKQEMVPETYYIAH